MRAAWFVLYALCSAFATDAAPTKADKVVVLKKDHTLQLLSNGKVFKEYKVALGPHVDGAKTQQGDGRTPEGSYSIDSRNAQSQFHRSLHISYPNAQDVSNAKAKHVSPGGDVFIHGLPPKYAFVGAAHRAHDWTLGCIAVTDAEIEEIWKLVPNGTPIEIRP
jgi:murein L,D-transpeptidase YafK